MSVSTVGAAPNGVASLPNMATGNFTTPSVATDISITLGFNPRWFKLYDEGDTLIFEKVQGDLPANYWKTGAAAVALQTDGGITFPADTGLQEPGSSVYILAALAGANKNYSWVALG